MLRLLWRVLRYLIGADVFISYARRDAGEYAGRLSDRLKIEKGVSVFIDQELSPVGLDLPKLLLQHLRLSRRMVVVVTDGAIGSHVEKEVAQFAETPRTVIPIDALRTAERPQWPGLAGAYWRHEDADAVRDGMPTDAIVGEILDTIGADRQSRRTRRAAAAAFAFVIVAAIASFAIIVAARRDAERLIEAAKRTADVAEQRARTARAAEKAAAANAAKQRTIADALALSSRAGELLRTDPKQRDRAVILAAGAVYRLHNEGAESVSANAVLRDMLEHSGVLEKRIVFGKDAETPEISRDGRWVVAADGSHIELWDTRRGRLRMLHTGSKHPTGDFEFSADGTHLAALAGPFSENSLLVGWRSLVIWRTNDGRRIAAATLDNRLKRLAIAANGAQYATWESGGKIRVWNTANGTQASTEMHHETEQFGNLSFSAKQELLGAGGSPCRVWKWTDPAPAPLWTNNSCISVAFNDDGTIAVAYGNGLVVAHSLTENRDLWTAREMRDGGQTISIDGALVAVAQDDAIEVRDLRSGYLEKRFAVSGVRRLIMKNRVIAAVFNDDTAAVYHVDGVPPAYYGHDATASNVALTPEGKIVSVTWHEAAVWNDGSSSPPRWIVSRALRPSIENVAMSPDARFLAVPEVGPNSFLEAWTIYDTARFRCRAKARDLIINSSAVAFAGETLLLGTAEGEVLSWNWRAGGHFVRLRRALDRDAPRRLAIGRIQVSPSGRFVAASTARDVVVWRLDRKHVPVLQFSLPSRVSLQTFAFGRSDDEIVTMSNDGKLRRWQWTDGKAMLQENVPVDPSYGLLTLEGGFLAIVIGPIRVSIRDLGHAGMSEAGQIDYGELIGRVAAAPGGLLMTAGNDGLLREWSWQPGHAAREVARIRFAERESVPGALALSADGRFVATANGKILEVRELSSSDLLQAACARLKNCPARKLEEYREVCTR